MKIGAEATVDGRERRAEALTHLYADLSRELKNLRAANGNGHKAQELRQDGTDSTVAVPQPTKQSIQPNGSNYYCQQHGVPFREYFRGNSRWYAHKDGAKWCREGKYTKVISERLGHASTVFTNDLYGQLMPGMEQAAAAKVDVALEGVISTPEYALALN